MAKDTYWFNHDFNSRNDEKILELRATYGAESYGVFWMVIETMAENENGGVKATLIGGLSLGYGVAKETLQNIIDFAIKIGLFYENEGYIFSKRFDKYKEFRSKFSKSGKEGAEKRWKNRGANGEANAKDKIREDNKNYNSLSLNTANGQKNEKQQFVNFAAQGEELYARRLGRKL